MGSLLLIDLSSVFYPPWHAGADKPIGFAYDVTVARVRASAREFDHVVVACDAGRSFRREIDPAYKANRPDADPMLIEQLRRVQDTLGADGYLIARADGFEADDVIATFATWAMGREEIGAVEILSSDKDLLALVSDRVTAGDGVRSVRARSVQTGALYSAADVAQKFGVRPDQIPDYLALVGDASDGVRGVRGIGPKHAAQLLGQYGTLDTLIGAALFVNPKSIRFALQAAIEDGSLDRARRLVALRVDVPLDCAQVFAPRDPKPVRPDFGADLDGEAMAPDAPTAADNTPPTPPPAPPAAAPDTPPAAPAATVAPAPATAPAASGASTAIVPALPVESRWILEPRDMRQAVWLAGKLFESRLFGNDKSGYGQPEQVLAAILAGREMGLGAMTSLRGIYVIKGRISMSSQLMVGLILSSGKAAYFDLIETDATKATYATFRRGATREIALTFTIEQARTMGLLEPSRSGEPKQWDKDPENMLRHRCAARLARIVYPDVCCNTYLPDELEDNDAPPPRVIVSTREDEIGAARQRRAGEESQIRPDENDPTEAKIAAALRAKFDELDAIVQAHNVHAPKAAQDKILAFYVANAAGGGLPAPEAEAVRRALANAARAVGLAGIETLRRLASEAAVGS